jgi:polyisoprenoid-binding protein YceI
MKTTACLHSLSAAGMALFLAVTACDTDPGKNKSAATIAAPRAITSGASAVEGTTTYPFSQADSKLTFVGAKVTRKHDGAFGVFKGAIRLVDGSVEKGSVTADVDIGSISVDEPKLTGHLKTPDFFDAVKFPTAHFVSTSVKAGGDRGASHTVTGNLDMHGVSKSVSFPATIKVREDETDVDAEFALNRRDFGIVYPGRPDDLIKDEVLIKLQIRAKRAP